MDRGDEVDPRFELRLGAGRPLPEVIADKLRELIDGGVFKPGSRLPNESDLARKMGVARSSVRTALQTLQGRGVVEVTRGVGWHVRRAVTPDSEESGGLVVDGRFSVPDLFEVRIGLEGLAATLAAVRATEGELADIEKLNADHKAAGNDRDELLRTDVAFHEAIVRASRNKLLIETYDQIIGELTDWRYRSYAERGVPLRSYRDHSTVVRFLGNHDPAGARAAMNWHLHRLYDRLPELGDEPLDSTFSGSDAEPEWPNRREDL